MHCWVWQELKCLPPGQLHVQHMLLFNALWAEIQQQYQPSTYTAYMLTNCLAVTPTQPDKATTCPSQRYYNNIHLIQQGTEPSILAMATHVTLWELQRAK
jgi:hypothetical protein